MSWGSNWIDEEGSIPVGMLFSNLNQVILIIGLELDLNLTIHNTV